jgi:predicted murein hydrolase (TIGR00659 family)
MNLLIYSLLTIAVFGAFQKLYNWKKWPILNPLFWSIATLIAFILISKVDYEVYRQNTQVISFFLGPATVVLAVPLYRQRELLKTYWLPIILGIGFSVIVSALSITFFSVIFNLGSLLHLSLLPKSLTTPIGISLSADIGGIPALTVISIIITGIAGAILSPFFLDLAKIKHPVAKGIAIGASSHVVGTTKAIELGEVEGAMSSLSIALAGIMTYFFIPPYLILLQHFIVLK